MKKIILAAAAILSVSILFYKLGLAEKLKDISLMQHWFQSLGFKGYFIFIIVSVLVAVFLLPGQFLAIIAGMAYGSLLGGALTVIGATLGSSISFVAAKYFARDYIVEKFKDNPAFQKIEAGVRENGISFLILTRLVPVFPFALQSYAYALTPIELMPFTVISFITMIPGCFIYSFMASEIYTNGFSVKLVIQFTAAGIILFVLSLIPKNIAKKKNISLD